MSHYRQQQLCTTDCITADIDSLFAAVEALRSIELMTIEAVVVVAVVVTRAEFVDNLAKQLWRMLCSTAAAAV